MGSWLVVTLHQLSVRLHLIVFGAYSYDIQISINGGAWQSSAVRMARFDTTWPFDGATYAIRVRTNCGMFDYLQSAWTASQSVVARPQLAAPPRNLQSYATETGTVAYELLLLRDADHI